MADQSEKRERKAKRNAARKRGEKLVEERLGLGGSRKESEWATVYSKRERATQTADYLFGR